MNQHDNPHLPHADLGPAPRRLRVRWTLGLTVLGIAGCLVGDLYLETSEVKVTGVTGDRSGYQIDIAGDLNGDGVNDLVITAPQIGVEEVYVFFGPIPPSELSTTKPDVVFHGETGGEAGWAVAVRDVTGEGKDDLIIAAPSEDGGGGVVHVLAGPLAPGSYTKGDAYAHLHGFGNFGWDVDGGDFDGDGKGDLVVGACSAFHGDLMSGAIFVFDGPLPAGDIYTTDARGFYHGQFHEGGLGCAVAAVGDVGGTGHDALLVGAYQESWSVEDPTDHAASGAAYLLYEPPSLSKVPIRSVADATFLGIQAIHNAGYAVGGRGDYNGDGFNDVLIGAPAEYCVWHAGQSPTTYCDIAPPPESVHVFFGGADPGMGPLFPPTPRLAGTYVVDEGDVNIYASHPDPAMVANPIHFSTFGMSVAWTNSAGRDGIDDILIGAPKLNRAYMVWGTDLPEPPSHINIDEIQTVFYLGDHADEHAVAKQHSPFTDSLYGPDAAGLAVAGGGDINLDGIEDVAISAPGLLWYSNTPAPRPGRTYVMYGSSSESQ